MSFFKDIKIKLANRSIRNQLKKNPRKKEFHNLESAKSIGVIFDTQDEANHKIVKKFTEDLAQKSYKVKAVAWVDDDQLPDFGVAQKILFYTNKDVKWNGEPIIPELKEFIDTRFDLLFILTSSDHLSVKYLTHVSNAGCKVGTYHSSSNHLDLMIEQTKDKSLEYLIKESLNYLTLIKKN